MRNFVIVAAAFLVVIFAVPASSQTPECETPSSPISEQPPRPDVPGNENDVNARSEVRPRVQEILLGRNASARYETAIKLFCDDFVHEYVNRITQKVAGGSNVRVPITIKVVDSSEVNALSFPGGFLYINTGLILTVESEAEIASVVAHEIAHVVARDGMRAQAVVLDPGASGGVNRPPDGVSGIGQIDGYLIPLSSLGARRETDADYNGIRYLQKSGYSPRALITFLNRMLSKEQTDPNSVLRMFQSHPPTKERIQRIGERIGYPSAIQNPVLDEELQKIKTIIVNRSQLPQDPSTSH